MYTKSYFFLPIIHNNINRLVDRYQDDEETRKQYKAIFLQQQRVALHLVAEKIRESFA